MGTDDDQHDADNHVLPRRWPRRLYTEGTEPDARFTLANERTFLAWIRTALALMAGGVGTCGARKVSTSEPRCPTPFCRS